MKKYFLALSLLILLSLKFTNAIDLELKEKKIKLSLHSEVKEFSEKEIELVKVDYGFFKNLKSKKYTIKKIDEVKILKEFNLKTKAVDAKFNKEKNIIISGQNGYKLENKIFEIDKVNKIITKVVEPNVTNKDAIMQQKDFKNILHKKIVIDGNETDLKVDHKWIDLNKNSAKINKNLLTSSIYKIMNKDKASKIILTENEEGFDLSERLNVIKKVSDIKIENNIEIQTEESFPKIVDKNGDELNILSVGRSNFEGSIPNRIYNVKEGAKVFSNLIIRSEDSFSYNNILTTKGANVIWKNAYIIVNGKDLKLSPGGGLCQTSTTLFRAALKAGLEIQNWKNHSIYVSYYNQYGDGLDSTIFPGKQDLIFKNNYKNDIFIISEVDESNNMYTYIIGKDDPKNVKLNGPFYGKLDNKMLESDIILRRNQIGWERKIDGRVENYISTYNGGVKVPESIDIAGDL